MSSVIEELVGNLLETRFEAFSDENIEDVKKRFIDVVGCAISGANASGNSMILDLVREWGGKKESTILIHGDRVPAHNAAMLNSIMCRSYDYEPPGPAAEGEAAGRMTGHICGTTEPTALAVAEITGSSGRELITAVILGGDMAARIGSADDFAFEHSFDPTGTVNGFGATAIAGVLWGLNKCQMLNAFGILVNQIAGSFQSIWDGVHTFKLHQGLSARDGIVSVQLASKGFTGIKDPLMSKRGYFAQYCKSYHPEFLTNELGKVFYTKAHFKLYPGCYAVHIGIESGLKLHRQYNINAEEIEEVTLSVPPPMYEGFVNQPFEIGDTQMKASFNIPYNTASVLLRKSVKLEHFTDEFLQDPKVIELVRKVRLVPAKPPEERLASDSKGWMAELKVKMKDGRELSAHAGEPRGTINNPPTKEEIKDKFRANVAFSNTVSRQNAEEVLTLLENLEEIGDVSRIVKLLVM